ncbi:MAG TPA: TolC family protein [Candidatus Dormibacteraeota bacterium]|nr:TolC family protein [Candidatus Dormibacteraeota bacterium]
MNAARKPGVALFGVLFLAGCAVRRYQPAPIVPADTASRFQLRNLADPALQGYEEKNLGRTVSPWPPKTWDLETLSLAALYFNPTLESARARVEEAEAATVTAGARPNPNLSIAPGVPSPYLLSLELAVPIETAGKRGYRVKVARNLDQAARFDLADSAWKIRSGVRLALLNYLLAGRNLELLRTEEEVRREQVALLEQRFSVGEIPRPELDLARIELSKTHLGISTAEGQVDEALAALAAAIGIPPAALQGFDFSWIAFESPPNSESLSSGQIQRDAVLNRLDVRRALAQYAAAEAELQLEISKQYPDIQIGPGYTYEERNNFFTLGLSTTLPLFNRNQGPIAEAEARRKEAASDFLERQAQVIADSERALARYRAALKGFTEADQSLRALQDTQQKITQRAVEVGEEDRLTLNGVRIESSVIARSRLDALGRAQSALGELEDAVQRPLDPGDTFSIAPDSSTLYRPRKEPER